MATDTTETRNDNSLAHLVSGIVTDAQELTQKQLELFKVEVRDNFEKAKGIGVLLAVATVVTIAAATMLGISVAQCLSWAFPNLPEWAGSAIVTLVLAAAAGILFGVWKQQLDSFSLFPERAVEAMKENLEWKTKPN